MGQLDHHLNLDAVEHDFKSISNRLSNLEYKINEKLNVDNLSTSLSILSIQIEEIKAVVKVLSKISINTVDNHSNFSNEVCKMIDDLQSKLREIIFILEK